MKAILLLTLALLSGPCGGRVIEPTATPTPSPSPTPWPKPEATWTGPHKYIVEGQQFWLVCKGSGKVIATVRNVTPSSEPWGVFGGDGAGYGEYVTQAHARQKAEEVVVNPNLDHKLLHCP